MVKVRQQEAIAMFIKGTDILEAKILRIIKNKDIYEPIYISDFKHLGRTYSTIWEILDKLEKQGYIVKVKAYPVFYERTELVELRKRRLG